MTELDFEEIFGSNESVSDKLFLEKCREKVTIWIDDELILDILDDEITMDEAEIFITPVENTPLDETSLFNGLANSYNQKIRADLSYLRGLLYEKTNGDDYVSEAVVEEVFANVRERMILFSRISDPTVENILKRVLRYLEGDIIVKTDKREYRASISS
jgi:hypothetical protein